MKTLIVPCAGRNRINQLPIYLNRHPDGKLFAEKAIQGIDPQGYDKIIYVTLAADREFNSFELLKREIGAKYPVEVCELAKSTNGPAGTVYQAIKKCNLAGSFAVRDSTSFITLKSLQNANGNFIVGFDLTKCKGNVLNLRSKSFIVTNDQDQVLDVIEKKFRSDVISLGLYGFESVDDYKIAYEYLNDKNYPIDKLYVSHIMSYLIGYKTKIFHYVEAGTFEDWGSLEAYYVLQKDYATCLVDLDALYGDGVGDLENPQINKLFRDSVSTNLSFIMFTKRSDVDRRKIEKKFRDDGVCCMHVIYLESKSSVRRYIESAEVLENVVRGV